MSTPSPVPLDNFDPVSPYAPRWARDHVPDAPVEPPEEPRRPAGIETDHDARILDEIEASLRAMIEGNQTGDEPERLADVSRAAAEQIKREQEELEQEQADDAAIEELASITAHASSLQPDAQRHQLANDMATVREAFRDPRTPPWLLARSLEPEPVPDPLPPLSENWPNTRKNRRSNKIFVRFGLAATGAAIVAVIAIKDVPSLVMDMVKRPMSSISTNAAAVFNEGKASSLQARMDGVQTASAGSSEPSLRYAVASVDAPARPVPVKTEVVGRAPEPKRETVMTPWPSPEAAKRSEPAGWQTPSVRVQPQPQAPAQAQPQPQPQASVPVPAPAPSPANDNATAGRSLGGEEIAMLRKMGDDYISNGDFVGARGVLERAAAAGDASAAFAIASTYDPVVLARFKVRGLEPDIVKAEFWYERARALGSSEAPHRLQAMMASRAN